MRTPDTSSMVARRTPPLFSATAYVVAATTLCFAVASPAIFGGAPDDLLGLFVPVAQLTPFLTALLFFLALRPGRFAEVFALRWGKSWRAVGTGFMAVIVIGVLQLCGGLLSGYTVSTAGAVVAAAFSVPVVLLMQAIFAIGEEFGWRGWLVTQLQHKSFWLIGSVSAVAWVAWHLPALPLIVGDGGWEPGAAYLLAIASWAPFLVALRLWSGSVWPAVIVHGALNSVRVFLTQSIATGDGINWFIEILGCVLWLVAAATLHSRVKRAQYSQSSLVQRV